MPLDGITSHFLAQELNYALEGGRVDKVYQPDNYDLYLHIRINSKNLILLLSANPNRPRCHLTQSTRVNPTNPPGFCALLRKYLVGGKIASIMALEWERIIQIRWQITDEIGDLKEYCLIIEMMNRHSNIILINENNKIIDSLIHVDNRMSRVREVMPARLYILPPVQDKFPPEAALELSLKGLLPLKSKVDNKELVKGLQESLLGFSPLLVKNILSSQAIDWQKKAFELTPLEKKQLLDSLITLYQTIYNTDPADVGYLYHESSTLSPLDFHALPLAHSGLSQKEKSISLAMEIFYKETDLKIDFQNQQKRLEQICQNALHHLHKKYQLHQTDITDSEDLELWQKQGQLILTHIYTISPQSEQIEVEDYWASEGKEDISQDASVASSPVFIQISLDPLKTPAQNAQIYFKRAQKAKVKREIVSQFMEEEQSAIDYFESLLQSITLAESFEDLDAIQIEINSLLGVDKNPKTKQPKFVKEIKIVKHKVKQIKKPVKSSPLSKNLNPSQLGQQLSKIDYLSSSDPVALDPFATDEASFGRKNPSLPQPGRSKSGKVASRSVRSAALAAEKKNQKNQASKTKPTSNKDNFRKYTSHHHLTILCGRNNIQNDQLVKSIGHSQDLWFHAQKRPGAHVLLQRNASPLSLDDLALDIEEAAQIAAYFARSKGESSWDQEKIAIDYCFVKQVKKPNKAKPGFVTYDQYKTLIVSPKLPSSQ